MSQCSEVHLPSLAALLLCIALAGISGCSGLSSTDEPQRDYWLQPSDKRMETLPSLSRYEHRITVSAPRGLDGSALLHLEPDGQLRRYSGAQWTDRGSEVVALFLRETLEQAVDHSTKDFPKGEAQVLVELRAFYTEGAASAASPAPVSARFRARVQLRCGRQSAQLPIDAQSPVSDERLAVIVAAHRRNLESFSGDVSRELDKLCSADALAADT